MTRIATIDPDRGPSPQAIPIDDVMQLLVDHGVVVFRGFGTSSHEFVRLTQRISDRFANDPFKTRAGRLRNAQGRLGRGARKLDRSTSRLARLFTATRDDDGTRLAPISGNGLNPHNENTFIPGGCPDLIWLHCGRPATDGGRSIFCDGSELLGVLSAATTGWLQSTRVRHGGSLPPAKWRAAYGIEHEPQLRALLECCDGVDYQIDPSGHFDYTYDALQIAPTRLQALPAFRSNLLSRRPYERVGRKERDRTVEGEPVPSSVVEDLLRGVEATRVAVDLERGDVAMVDNSRIMHGREPFADTSRRVTTRLGWLRQELVDANR